MQKHTTSLIAAEDIANGTKAFTFATPEGFTFTAGQYVRMTIPNMQEMDDKGSSRKFSIASSPEDASLRFATRMRDTAFKRALGAMQPGAEVEIEGPMGSLTLPDDPMVPVVFLAGGIGITPFISMVRHAGQAMLTHNITLFYSNKTVEDGPFLPELRELAAQNPHFTMIETMTDLAPDAVWSGERGFIDEAMFKRHLKDPKAPIYFVAGPPGMVTAMQKTLKSMGIPDTQLKTEEFEGY